MFLFRLAPQPSTPPYPPNALFALLGNAIGSTDLVGNTLTPLNLVNSSTSGAITFPTDVERIDVISNPSQFAVGTGPFTISCFVNFSLSQVDSNGAIFISLGRYGTPTGLFTQLYTSGGVPYFYVGEWVGNAYSIGINVSCDSAGFVDNTRTHVALCRDSNQVLRVYVGGVEVGSASYTRNIESSVEGLFLGGIGNAIYQYNGKLDHVLMTNTALYTSNFTPPTGF